MIKLTVVLKCAQHPNYRGLRPPKVQSEKCCCMALWKAMQAPVEFAVEAFDPQTVVSAKSETYTNGQDTLH